MRVKFNDISYQKPSLNNEDLFGKAFAKDSEQFQFLPGERLLIKELAAHVKRMVDDGGTNGGILHFQQTASTIASNVSTDTSKSDKLPDTSTHFFLHKLLTAANRNSTRKKGGYRFDSEIKFYASYLRMICGPLAYETIQKNLECALPSLTSVNRYIKSANCHIIEGVLRSEELLLFLKERDLPLAVSISEDATRIIGRVQYDSSTNQLIGFTSPLNHLNGMPMTNSFPARSAEEIYGHFFADHPIANFLNVVMAQPIDSNAKPFCLLAYGSDNCYSSNDVLKRWMYITNELAKLKIKVLAISSDSDPRYNGAMRELSTLGCGNSEHAEWFSCDHTRSMPYFFQDTVHIGTKMRNFFLRTIKNEKKCPFGKYFINWNHINFILNNFSKDEHQLTASVLNPIDRQNFHSVLKLCHPRVIVLLKQHVKGSEATILFLQMMKDVIDALLDRDLRPLERVRKIWYPTFVFRIWREFIRSQKNCTLKDNFLTSNCYSCLEINAHALIMCMSHLKAIDRPDLFLPYLFESQPCESMFRQFRSFTSTYSTVTNCTVKEAMSRISKIQLQNDIIHGTSSNFMYPRLNKQHGSSYIETNKSIVLPTRIEIIAEIQNCQRDAIVQARKLGLISKKNKTDFSCKIPPYSSSDKIQKKRKNQNSNTNKIAFPESNFNNIQLKNFADKLNEEIDTTGPYAEIITDDGKRIVVIFRFLTSLCWLWRVEYRKLSNDRLLRVQYSKKRQERKQIKKKITKSAVHACKSAPKK